MKECKDCPAYEKCTAIYRGSACAALRYTYGIESDPEISMTNAQKIRAMSDEELAELIEQIVSERDHYLLKKLHEAEIDAELYEMPEISKRKHLEWLQQPAEEDV